jgi:asparaginyl-tRNA synthetase
MPKYIPIRSIDSFFLEKSIQLKGWIESVRFSKKTVFVKLYDSWRTHLQPIQIVFDLAKFSDEQKTDIAKFFVSCSIGVTGILIASPKAAQPFEIQATDFIIYGLIHEPATFPIAKAELSLDYLRSFPSIECFAVTKSAIYGIRSLIQQSFEKFFEQEDFTKTDMPIITFSECEGGCQPLQVTQHFATGNSIDVPLCDKSTMIDFSKDFFGKKASLTVSSQLELETHLPLGKVWTMTRAVRGEPSLTSRHLAEFSMLEYELPFIDSAQDVRDITERLIQHTIKYVMDDKYGKLALEYLSKKFSLPIIEKLDGFISKPFDVITHRDAVKLLLEKHDSGSVTFTKLPDYADDMGSEHERYLTDVYYKHPVIVTEYPKHVKAFYMPVSGSFVTPDGRQVEYVDCFDILVPGVGELVGGSARIHDHDELEKRISELGLDSKPLEFYTVLRKYGTQKHGGMGLGLERLVSLITFAGSVRDCVAYPRFYQAK